MALRRTPVRVAQQVRAVRELGVECLGEFGQAHGRGPGRGHLDRERQPVQAADHTVHEQRVGPVGVQARGARPLEEQAARGRVDALCGEWLERSRVLLGQSQALTARRDQAGTSAFEEALADLGGGIDDVLAVVEKHEEVESADVAQRCPGWTTVGADAQRRDDRRRHAARVAEGRQLDDACPLVPAGASAQHLQRDARLADPAGSQERDEAHPVEQRVDRGDVALATDERGAGDRHRGGEGHRRCGRPVRRWGGPRCGRCRGTRGCPDAWCLASRGDVDAVGGERCGMCGT